MKHQPLKLLAGAFLLLAACADAQNSNQRSADSESYFKECNPLNESPIGESCIGYSGRQEGYENMTIGEWLESVDDMSRCTKSELINENGLNGFLEEAMPRGYFAVRCSRQD